MFKNPFPDKPAGMLIDAAGCKGMRIGNAMVSQKHANYFINRGGAHAKEIIALADKVKDRVREVHHIMLQEEIQIYS
jgi:UDP-N-acetylmuramate dehydrogenase